MYEDDANSDYGTYVVGTVSGTSISFGSEIVFEAAAVEDLGMAFDSNANRMVMAYQDEGNSSHGTAIIQQSGVATNLTTENYIGIASGGTYADGQSMTVDTIGTVNADQSSLTAGQQYFVQEDGTLGLTADSTSVIAGTAISATELMVKE